MANVYAKKHRREQKIPYDHSYNLKACILNDKRKRVKDKNKGHLIKETANKMLTFGLLYKVGDKSRNVLPSLETKSEEILICECSIAK